MLKKTLPHGLDVAFQSILIILLVALTIESQAQPQYPLKSLAARNNIRIGSCVRYNKMDEEKYLEAISSEFNILTPESAMKWTHIHPSQYQYNFGAGDVLADFAQANGMAFHGHTLLWHLMNPAWLTSGSFTQQELTSILYDHIDTVAGHYAGRVLVWDVVNEAFESDGSLRDTLWRKGLGDDYIALAFTRARQADPAAKLILNDYNVMTINNKSDAMYALVQSFLSQGVPIDGVGFQMHLSMKYNDITPVTLQSFADNMARFAALGMEIYVTELDIRMKLPASQQDLENQGEAYRGIMKTCLNQSACKAFQMWGITDKYSWIPSHYTGYGAALIYDASYNKKSAYDALYETLLGAATSPSKNAKGLH